jgi:hypothetical protein
MKRFTTVATVVAASFILAGCEGDDGLDGLDGSDGNDGFNSLVRTRDLPKGDADCPGGGKVLESGLDTNRNDVLDDAEVTARDFLSCGTAPRIRAVHASPDAPKVNVWVDGAVALPDVDYTDGSGFVEVGEEARVQVEAIIPGGNAIVIDETLDLDFSQDYTIIAAGRVADPIGALVFANPTDEALAAGNVRAQFVHAAPAAPAVDIYVTAPDADLGTSTPVNGAPLAYKAATDRIVAPAGQYQVRVTLAGDSDAVVYDTGALDLAAGADLMAVAVENTGTGATPIQVVLLDGTTAVDLLDANTPAAVVAVHASPDAPAVDVLADVRETAEDEGIVLAQGLPFAEVCEIPAVPAPGEYLVSITATGDPNTVALQFDLDPQPADDVTAIVSGYLGSTPEIQLLPLLNDRRSVLTEAKLRVTHGSPGTGEVDLYLVADGTDLNDPGTQPAFAAVPFGADTGILSIPPGTYDVYVTPTGDKGVVAIEVQDLVLNGGEVLDVIARDAKLDDSEGALPQLVVVDYSAVPACPAP